MISRWRKKRREKKTQILPTTVPLSGASPTPKKLGRKTYTSPKPGSINCIPRINGVNPNAVGCTTFLMGGQYYPGKDKKRLQMRRRTLWYRIFWSSNYRRGLTGIVILYLLVVYCLNPGLNSILHYGKILSNHEEASPTENVGNKYVKPLRIAKKDAEALLKRLKEIKNEKVSKEGRKELIRKIIPDWLKRDGGEGYGDDTEDGQDEQDEQDEPDKEAIEQSHVQDDNEQDPDLNPPEIEIEKPSEAEVSRTLWNQSEHYKHSQCRRNVDDLSTTLVTQATYDRLPLIRKTCQRWKSPMNAVIYLTLEESQNIWDDTVKEYGAICPHLNMIPYIAKSTEERRLAYPINRLRNIGLDAVTTSYVFVLDVDFIPSNNLDEALLKAIKLAIEARLDDDGDRGVEAKDAIVVPAFDRKPKEDCTTLEGCINLSNQYPKFIPSSMTDLERCVANENCIVFQSDVNWEGHFDTKSSHWLEKKNKSSLTTIECFHSLRYEPYVVVPWCPLERNVVQRIAMHGPRSPYYDERFYGYGKNKIQYIAHLRQRGFKFAVMQPAGFVIHHPHPESITKQIWNDKENNELHHQMDELYPQYIREIYKQYDGNFIETPICKKD